MAAALADGIYLCRWPKLAALAPPVVFVFGVIAGWTHFSSGETFTFSLILMAVFTVIACFGAGLGTWCWLGYVVGDVLLYQIWHTHEDLLLTLGAAFLSYVLLALLLIFAPIIAKNIRRRAFPALFAAIKHPMARQLAESLAQGLILALLVFVWVHAVPILIRPLYTWFSGSPPVPAIRPLQEDGMVLVVLAAIFGTLRMFLQFFAFRRSAVADMAWSLQRTVHQSHKGAALPPWVQPLLVSIFSVFLLSGVLASWVDAFVLVVILFALNLARQMVVPKLPGWAAMVLKVPWLVRFPVALLLSYGLAWAIIGGMWSSTYTFRPVAISVIFSYIVFVLFFPSAPKRTPVSQAATQ